jgi:hypothetical protein
MKWSPTGPLSGCYGLTSLTGLLALSAASVLVRLINPKLTLENQSIGNKKREFCIGKLYLCSFCKNTYFCELQKLPHILFFNHTMQKKVKTLPNTF